jgi:hypothetical protein
MTTSPAERNSYCRRSARRYRRRCGDTGDFLLKDKAGALCLDRADLGHLEFLPSGDAALTRRATKASRLSAVVVR